MNATDVSFLFQELVTTVKVLSACVSACPHALSERECHEKDRITQFCFEGEEDGIVIMPTCGIETQNLDPTVSKIVCVREMNKSEPNDICQRVDSKVIHASTSRMHVRSLPVTRSSSSLKSRSGHSLC